MISSHMVGLLHQDVKVFFSMVRKILSMVRSFRLMVGSLHLGEKVSSLMRTFLAWQEVLAIWWEVYTQVRRFLA